MSSLRDRTDIYRALIHPSLSIFVGLTASLAGLFLVTEMFGLATPKASVVILTGLAPFVEAIIGNIIHQQRANIGNRVRELILFLILAYLVFSLSLDGPLVQRFIPSRFQLVPLIPVALTWIVCFLFHNRLRGREFLLRLVKGKHDAELRRAILDRQHDMVVAVTELRQAKKILFGVFIFFGLLAAFGSSGLFEVSRVTPRSLGFILFLSYGLAVAIATSALNGFIEEYAANGEGISVPVRFQRRRFIAALIVIVIVLTLSLVLSSSRSYVPPGIIRDFFAWFGSLFEREREARPMQLPTQPNTFQDPYIDLLEQLGEAERQEPALWLRMLARMIERLLIAAGVAGALVLLFGPLFSSSFRDALRKFKPMAFLKDLGHRLRHRLKLMMRVARLMLRRRGKSADAKDEEQEKTPAVGFSKRFTPGLRKRRQMDRVLTVFVSITKWGAQQGVPYNRPLATREYMRSIAERFPATYQSAMTVADLFCEARFSTHLVETAKMREYVRAAKMITRSKPDE